MAYTIAFCSRCKVLHFAPDEKDDEAQFQGLPPLAHPRHFYAQCNVCPHSAGLTEFVPVQDLCDW